MFYLDIFWTTKWILQKQLFHKTETTGNLNANRAPVDLGRVVLDCLQHLLSSPVRCWVLWDYKFLTRLCCKKWAKNATATSVLDWLEWLCSKDKQWHVQHDYQIDFGRSINQRRCLTALITLHTWHPFWSDCSITLAHCGKTQSLWIPETNKIDD